jgi:hypothetical protein
MLISEVHVTAFFGPSFAMFSSYVYIKVLSPGISSTPRTRHGCQTDFSNMHIPSKYVFHRIGGSHPQHALSFAVYKILNAYLRSYNMILLFVNRPFTLRHEFQRSISFSQNFQFQCLTCATYIHEKPQLKCSST